MSSIHKPGRQRNATGHGSILKVTEFHSLQSIFLAVNEYHIVGNAPATD